MVSLAEVINYIMVSTMSTKFSFNGSPPQALVTGGNGFLGSHLVEALLQRGYRVRCLVRRGSDLRWIKGLKLDLFVGDLSDPSSLRQAVRGADYIYHLAGLTKAIRPELYYDVNGKGTKNLLDVCSAEGKRLHKFIYVSSLAAIGPGHRGIPLKEEAPPRPLTDYGRSKLEGEREVWRYQGKIPVTIIRPPVIYGPRDRQLLSFFQIVKRGILPVLSMKLSLAYVLDVVAILLLAGEREKSRGEAYFVCGPMVSSWGEIGKIAGEIMGVKSWRLHLPALSPYPVALFYEALSFFTRRPTVLNLQKAREMSQRYWVCDHKKAGKELGFHPQYPLQQGLEETIKWYKSQGWL